MSGILLFNISHRDIEKAMGPRLMFHQEGIWCVDDEKVES